MAPRRYTSSPAVSAGLLAEIVRNLRLVWRLLRDPRVATVSKFAVPAVLAAYLLWPADLLPDFLPLLGQLDDLAILALAVRMFIQMAPPEVVAQHQSNLDPGDLRAGTNVGQGEVVDGEYRVVE